MNRHVSRAAWLVQPDCRVIRMLAATEAARPQTSGNGSLP